MSLKTAFLKGQAAAYFDQGLSLGEISKKIKIHKATIQSWKNQNFRFIRRKGSGRLKKTTSRTDRQIVRLSISNNQLTCNEIAAEVATSNSTVWRRLKSAGIKCKKRKYEISLTEDHRKQRLQWAMQHCIWREPAWSKIVFSDEACFKLRSKDNRLTIWYRSMTEMDSNAVPVVQGGGGSCMIWGAIWIGGRSELSINRGIIDAERYVKILEDYLLPVSYQLGDPSNEWKFMHDNAPIHTGYIYQAFEILSGIQTINWPSRSPDLNPMEHVWSWLKRWVRRRLTANDTLATMEKLISEGWNAIPQDTIDSLIKSMNRRIESVIQSKGGNTKY